VGRGSLESHCLLLYHAPLSRSAQERIETLRATTDGFEIARRDLEMRGPGEVLGTRQTGEAQFRVADPMRDEPLLGAAQQAADVILDRYPERVQPLVERWFGGRVDYGGV
jgi:ATP-dependent DNA helicase RecG